jgi:hypothetical protein
MICASFIIEKNAKYSKKRGAFQNINHNTGSPHCPRQYPEPIAILLTIEIMLIRDISAVQPLSMGYCECPMVLS